MKRRLFAIVVAGTMMLSVAGTAGADQGGVPNDSAFHNSGCGPGFGQATSDAASTGNNPNDRANRFDSTVQDIQQDTKDQFC